jgi:hypothetical protein
MRVFPDVEYDEGDGVEPDVRCHHMGAAGGVSYRVFSVFAI